MAWNHGGMEATRVDRWLWAVRLFKTRSAASDACRGGHVRVNDARVKPAALVRVGDTIRARVGDRERIVEVAKIIETRVGAPVAAECLVDHSPPVEPRAFLPPVAKRERGAGRPSKRERRQLDRSRGRRHP
jgi:ribosome-associated heat shock protein Hsp15